MKVPTLTAAGSMPVRTGVGFRSVTELDPVAEGSAELTAVMVTAFGEGREAGAVYFPLESMVPRAAEPPGVEFTDQVTAILEAPETAATKVA